MRNTCGSQKSASEAAIANDLNETIRLQALADAAKADAAKLGKIAEEEAKPVEAAEKVRKAAEAKAAECVEVAGGHTPHRPPERQTGRKIPQKQIDKLKDALRSKKYSKVSKEEAARNRFVQFDRVKDRLIEDWERETGQAWPRYTEDVMSKDGTKVVRKAVDEMRTTSLRTN